MKSVVAVVVLVLIAVVAGPLLVAAVMDLFSIAIHTTTGWELGLGFVENTLAIWPGGEIFAALLFDQPVTVEGVISGVIQVLVVAIVRILVPPLTGRTETGFRIMRLLGIGLVDAVITCLISIAVGWVFSAWLDPMLERFGFVQILVGIACAGFIVVCALIALRVLKRGRALFAFGIITAVGRFAVTTFALITWSVNNIAGAFTIFLCVLACGVLAMVDGRAARYW
jgi:hypothetical protein